MECYGDIDEGCPTIAEGRGRKSFLEMMPELNLREQLAVSQANEATVKVIWAKKTRRKKRNPSTAGTGNSTADTFIMC